MARRKTPENETEEQKIDRLLKEKVAGLPSRSEKIAWNRKMSNLRKIYDEHVHPLEEEIIELMAKKQPHLDKMQALRADMVNNCIHPYDHLVVKDGAVWCKFCDTKLTVVNDD